MTVGSASAELQYIAMQIYRLERYRQDAGAVRWWCLRDDMKAEYIAKAAVAVGKWHTDEMETKARVERETPMPPVLPNTEIRNAPRTD